MTAVVFLVQPGAFFVLVSLSFISMTDANQIATSASLYLDRTSKIAVSQTY